MLTEATPHPHRRHYFPIQVGEDLDSLQVKSELDIRLPEFHSGESEKRTGNVIELPYGYWNS